MDNQSLEKRVEELEKELAELKAEIRSGPAKNDWLKTFGWAKDDPEYEEMARLGAAWRKRQPKTGVVNARAGHRPSQRARSVKSSRPKSEE